MHREHERVRTIPAFLICDHRFIRKYGLGLVRPGPGPHGKYLRSGYLTRARSVSMLAQALDLPPETLQQTIENNNRSEEHTSELQSLMRSSYAVFCLTQQATTETQKQ